MRLVSDGVLKILRKMMSQLISRSVNVESVWRTTTATLGLPKNIVSQEYMPLSEHKPQQKHLIKNCLSFGVYKRLWRQ